MMALLLLLLHHLLLLLGMLKLQHRQRRKWANTHQYKEFVFVCIDASRQTNTECL
jgi:hypothetical protein